MCRKNLQWKIIKIIGLQIKFFDNKQNYKVEQNIFVSISAGIFCVKRIMVLIFSPRAVLL